MSPSAVIGVTNCHVEGAPISSTGANSWFTATSICVPPLITVYGALVARLVASTQVAEIRYVIPLVTLSNSHCTTLLPSPV